MARLEIRGSCADRSRYAAAALTRDLRGRLASYKVPTELHFIEEIPRNGAGKALKRVLRTRHVTRPRTD